MASASTHQWKYDVFLSFRGVDVRKNFLSHLYAALNRKGVYAFKDDKELERGQPISDDLLQAIKDSRFCIIIFSKRYADSTWCLDELITIFQRVQQEKLTAIPVFYGVKTCVVQELEGDYGKAFEKHEKDYEDDIQKVQEWKVAITTLALHSGHSLEENRDEEQFIDDIVEDIVEQLRKLKQKLPISMEKGFVGVDKHLRQLDLYLDEKLNDVCIIGICGMGGIGKSTIARAFFEEKSPQFETRSFLANVRERAEKDGLIPLQKQLLFEIALERNLGIWETNTGAKEIQNRLWHKKVLIILDDVDKLEQLNSLAAESNWFGSGSRIVITTRNEQLLTFYDECLIYKVPKLDDNDAHQLFYSKAFRNGFLRKDFKDLSFSFVKYCDGLPLAIDVLGSFLQGISSKKEWESALLRLKEVPDGDIIDKLKISFDSLQEIEQKIFLDVACFFKGNDQDYLKAILESCGFYPDIGIRVLINKSLITINSNNEVWMHDLLQKMGREIVRRQSPEEPGKRSRIWLYEDIYHVFLNNTGTEIVEGIVIEDWYKQKDKWLNVEALSFEVFSKMKRLRLLKLRDLHINHGVEFLPNSLRYLDWYQFPLKFLPIGFQPNELVELHMWHSNVNLLWKAMKPLKMLKVINLSHSKKLEKTPDFIEVPQLEQLNLMGCIRLFEIHHSIGALKKLFLLNLEDCENLTTLPNSIGDVKSLKVLKLRGCLKLVKLPKSLGQLTGIEILNLGRKSKEEQLAKPWDFLFPWKRTTSLVSLTLPFSLSNMCSLKKLDLSYCHLIGGLPNDFGCLPLLETLILSGNDFVSIPSSINRLSRLQTFVLVDCAKLKTLPEFPSSVDWLNMSGCVSMETFPVPFECATTDRLRINCANGFRFVKNQHETNITFEWLASYLKFVLTMKRNDQEYLNILSHFSMYVPGSAIPRWFSFKSYNTPTITLPHMHRFDWKYITTMIVSLPSNWCNDQWLGFAICTILCCDPSMKTGKTGTYLVMKIGGVIFSDTNKVKEEVMHVISDQDRLWVVFTPMALEATLGFSVDWWNNVSEIEIKYEGFGLKVKSWGFRIVYEQDVQELLQYNSPSRTEKFLITHEE